MSVELNETDVRELNWVADAIEAYAQGSQLPTREDGLALAGVVRSKLPAPKVFLVREVQDRNGETYIYDSGKWYLVRNGQALEVPWESILDPRPSHELEVVA